MKKRIIVGYGFKLKEETITKMLFIYYNAGGFCKNKKEVIEDIKKGKQYKNINRSKRPKIFKILVEEV